MVAQQSFTLAFVVYALNSTSLRRDTRRAQISNVWENVFATKPEKVDIKAKLIFMYQVFGHWTNYVYILDKCAKFLAKPRRKWEHNLGKLSQTTCRRQECV